MPRHAFTMHKSSQSLTSGHWHRSHLAGTASIHVTFARREWCVPGRSANVVSQMRIDMSAGEIATTGPWQAEVDSVPRDGFGIDRRRQQHTNGAGALAASGSAA